VLTQSGVKTHIVRNIITFDTDANADHSGDVITASVEKGDPGLAFIHILVASLAFLINAR